MVEDAVTALNNAPTAVMSTVKTPIWDLAEWRNPNVVKVVTDREGIALYFSRSPIPFRSRATAPQSRATINSGIPAHWFICVST